MPQERTILYAGVPLRYLLEQKPVKNLNLRIHRDGSVFVSAHPAISVERVDAFVAGKGGYIRSAQKRFQEMAQYAPQPKRYVSGETFYLLGRGVRLSVEKNVRDTIWNDGVYLHLQTKDPDDFSKKQGLVTAYLDEQCHAVFSEILSEIYPIFQKYGIPMPALRIRNMETRWGSCLAQKGIITLNKRLLEAPRHCIEYVVMHELCHFLHPDHSKRFYTFLTTLMPDWRERKSILDQNAVFWL